MAVEDLGVIHKTATLAGNSLWKYLSEQVWSVATFWYTGYDTPVNILAINNDTDVVTVQQGPLGRLFVIFMHPDDGLFYIGTDRGTSYPGQYGSYNHRTGTYTALGVVPRSADGIQFATYSDETNKRIFWGSSNKGGLHAWDPVLESEHDYGILDDPGSYPDVRYIPTIEVDGSYAYCEMRQAAAYGANNVSYFVIVQLSNGQQTVKWKGTPGLTITNVRRGYDENIYIKKTISGIDTWWQVDGINDPTEVSEPGVYSAYPPNRGNVNVTSYISGYATDDSKLHPWVTGDVILRYKRPLDTDYREKSATILNVEDYPIKRGVLDFDGNLILTGDIYAPIAKYYTQTDVNTKLGGIYELSGYSFALDWPRGLIWLGGYPSDELWKYDPTQALENSVKITVMPDTGIPKYYYNAIVGSDRLVWLGTQYVRQTSGTCSLAWYNLDNNTAGHIAWEGLNLVGAVSNLARNKIVVSLSGVGGALTGKLAVIPVRKKGVSKYLYPLGTSINQQGVMVSVETNRATNNHFVGITSGVDYKIYCLNIGTGTFVWEPITITGYTSVVDGTTQSVTFANGYVWFYEGTSIVRTNPADGTIYRPTITPPLTAAGGMIWKGTVLYHYDSTTKHLWRITGLV